MANAFLLKLTNIFLFLLLLPVLLRKSIVEGGRWQSKSQYFFVESSCSSTSSSCTNAVVTSVGSTPKQPQERREKGENERRIIIDTDVDFDDLIAIEGILSHVKAEKVALITTVAGANTPQGAASLINNVLKVYNNNNNNKKNMAPIIPPVAMGLEQQKKTQGTDNSWSWLEETRKDLNAMNKKIMSKYGIHKKAAAESFRKNATNEVLEILKEAPDESIDLICLGPLSNIDDWIKKGKQNDSNKLNLLEIKIKSVWIMGGNLPPPPQQQRQDEPFDKSTLPEFNFALDPQAAANVLTFFSERKKPVHLLTTDDSGHNILPLSYVNSIVSELKQIHRDEKKEEEELISHLITTHSDVCLFWDVMCAFAYTTQNINHDDNNNNAEQRKYNLQPMNIQVDNKSGLILNNGDGATTVMRIYNISLPYYRDWIQSLAMNNKTSTRYESSIQ